MSLEALFCDVDDFCQVYLPQWQKQQLSDGSRQRQRTGQMTLSEIMTVAIHFHQSHYRDFKAYYLLYVSRHLAEAFPRRVSYTRLVALLPSVLMPLCVYLEQRKGVASGIAFIDATSIVVCHNRRIRSHKVFKQVARRGKTSTGWFYGFKLHLVVNDWGELLAFQLTPGNVDDRAPVPKLVHGLTGKLFADKGYLSNALFEALLEQDLQLITRLRKNMKGALVPLIDKILLRKRALIETIFDQLKNICQIEHSRHRSGANFLVNLVAGLIAYTQLPSKPSLNIRTNSLKQFAIL